MTFIELLDKKKSELMDFAEEEGYDFSNQTKKAVIAKEMADDIESSSSAGRSDTWWNDFRKAAREAAEKAVNKDRSYHVFEKVEGENMFNIAPSYMKYNEEEKNPLLTVTRYSN